MVITFREGKGENHKALKDFLTFLITYNNALAENEMLLGMDQTHVIRKLNGKLQAQRKMAKPHFPHQGQTKTTS